MLKIYSPSGRERKLSTFLHKEMDRLGFRVWKDEVGNVVGEVGQGDHTVLLCGHMDTVPGFIPVRFENNRLYGRGVVDAKASLAAMVVAASTLSSDDLANRILFYGVVDEEGSSKGIKHLLKKRVSADYAIFGEPSGVEKIVIGYKGGLRLRITCETKTGHSAASWLFENAIEKALEIWEMMRKLHLPGEKPESRFYSITLCLTKIEGGQAYSTVPSECTIYIDLRVPPQFTCRQIFAEVRELIQEYKNVNPKVSVELKTEGQTEPFEVDKNSHLVRSLAWAIRKVTSKPATLLRKTGTGDMNIFGKATGIPVISYGPGDSRLDHTSNEYVNVQEYLNSIQVYRKAVIRLLNLYAD